jgi:hypothetical protein
MFVVCGTPCASPYWRRRGGYAAAAPRGTRSSPRQTSRRRPSPTCAPSPAPTGRGRRRRRSGRLLDGVSPRVLNRRHRGALGPASVADFELKWCGGGVVAYVAHRQGRRPTMEFRLRPPSAHDCRTIHTHIPHSYTHTSPGTPTSRPPERVRGQRRRPRLSGVATEPRAPERPIGPGAREALPAVTPHGFDAPSPCLSLPPLTG